MIRTKFLRSLVSLRPIALTLCAAMLATLPLSAQEPAAGQANGPWWKHAVFYEIYPRSFQDSNGDGVGDLNGITSRLDYLQSLGINAIWLSPIYPSPQVDFGYDISNYENIDPQYGTLADFDRLLAQAKQRHIRIIMDMVLNHTSDKHKWFIESASSRTNAKADWYDWNDGVPANSPGITAFQKKYVHDGKVPPNNWESEFGGSAWQWDPARKQFYYHRFYKQQPDLNWSNPAVQKAMFDVVRFWLDRGVAGFRFDAITTLFEDPQLRNEASLGGLNVYGDPNISMEYQEDLPRNHDVVRDLRKVIDSYPGDRVMIGETYLPNVEDLNRWYGGAEHNQFQLPMDMQVGMINRMDAPMFRKRIHEAETEIDGNRPLFVFDNHDNVRSWNRYDGGVHGQSIARVLASVLLTTRSTALMYYGEEIGMVTTPPKTRAEVKDPIGKLGWPKYKGRDGERTPMQWSNTTDAGFSTAATTWLPVASDYHTVNVKTEEAEPQSLLNWYKKLIAMRATDPTLRYGEQAMLEKDNPSVLSYVRKSVNGNPSIVVALNFTARSQTISLHPETEGVSGNTVKTMLTDADSLQHQDSLQHIVLPPFASWIGSVQ